MSKGKGRRWTLAAVGSVIVAAILVFGLGIGLGGDAVAATEGAEVQRGSLRISVVERGNLKAAQSVTLKSEIEGQTTVLYLIEEGKLVEPGTLLCELDVSSMEDERVEQGIRVQNREAEYVKAQQDFEIQESQNASDIARADRLLEFARIDLQKYLEGDKPQLLQKAEEDILLAEEDLTLATQDLEWSEKLAERGFLEQTQLDLDRLTKTRSEVKLNQVMREQELLISYNIPRAIAELEADVEENTRELERVRLQSKARIADYEAALRASKARFDLEKTELERIEEQIGNGKLIAPVAGMVVYAMEDRGRWGGGEPMQEGAVVRERQEIITIPSAEGFIAEVSLHESVLEKVEVGVPCLVTVDALEGKSFRGEVKFKAVLPDQQSWFANPDLRVYRSEVRLVEIDERMRPGMSCSVEILVDEIRDTTYVPVQSVFLDAGSPVCFVSSGAGIEKRPVEVGQNNGKWVEITSGLQEAEVVLLSQPTGFALDPAVEEMRQGGDAWGERPEGGRPEGGGSDGRRRHGGPVAGAAPADEGSSTESGAPRGDATPTVVEEGGQEGEPGQGAPSPEQIARWRERMQELEKDPEAMARFRKQMEEMRNDPEARERFRAMMQNGGGGGGSPGGDATQGTQ